MFMFVVAEVEISNLPVGLAVPIPKFPDASIRILSTPPSENAMVSAAGKNIPVLASVPRMAGVAAEPSTSERPSVPERISDMSSSCCY